MKHKSELEIEFEKYRDLAIQLQGEWAHSGSPLEPEDWVARNHPDKLADYKKSEVLFEQVIMERRARKARQALEEEKDDN